MSEIFKSIIPSPLFPKNFVKENTAAVKESIEQLHKSAVHIFEASDINLVKKWLDYHYVEYYLSFFFNFINFSCSYQLFETVIAAKGVEFKLMEKIMISIIRNNITRIRVSGPETAFSS